jgi:formylglycine-generating enzyme required for sulfatase activity
MIVIPAGTFTRGSPDNEPDREAPADASAWLGEANPNYRVVRGGSWRNESELVRSAVRFSRNVNVRFDTLGFRIARAMHD